MHRLRTFLQLPLDLSCRPLRRTNQDKFAAEWLFAGHAFQQPVYVTGFRGARKTFTFRRLAVRRAWMPWLRRVRYLDAAALGVPRVQAAIDEPRGWARLGQDLLLIPSLLIAYKLVSTIFHFFKDGDVFDGDVAGGKKEFSDYAEKALPSIGQIYLTVIAASLFALRRRRPALIIDDPLNSFAKYVMDAPGCAQLGALYAPIRFESLRRPIMILSSNEGILECMDDRNTSTFMHGEFPSATPANLARALHSISYEPQHQFLYGIQEADVKTALELLPEHHALSVRWFVNIGESGWAVLKEAMAEEANVDEKWRARIRPHLFNIVQLLDLEACMVLRAADLGYSAKSTDKDKEKLVHLTGVSMDDLPKDLPRRLALTWALLGTYEDNDVENFIWGNVLGHLEATSLVTHSRNDWAFEKYVDPLIKAIANKNQRAEVDANAMNEDDVYVDEHA